MRRLRNRLRARWARWRVKPLRSRVDRWAQATALAVAVTATVAVWPLWAEVVHPLGHSHDRDVTIEVRPLNGRNGRTTHRKAIVRRVDRGLASTILRERGVLLLGRLAMIGIASFLAGAVVQRLLLAKFAIKVGPLQFEEPDALPLSRVSEIVVGGLPSPEPAGPTTRSDDASEG